MVQEMLPEMHSTSTQSCTLWLPIIHKHAHTHIHTHNHFNCYFDTWAFHCVISLVLDLHIFPEQFSCCLLTHALAQLLSTTIPYLTSIFTSYYNFWNIIRAIKCCCCLISFTFATFSFFRSLTQQHKFITTILWPLWKQIPSSRHLQLTTREFCWSKFLLLESAS